MRRRDWHAHPQMSRVEILLFLITLMVIPVALPILLGGQP